MALTLIGGKALARRSKTGLADCLLVGGDDVEYDFVSAMMVVGAQKHMSAPSAPTPPTSLILPRSRHAHPGHIRQQCPTVLIIFTKPPHHLHGRSSIETTRAEQRKSVWAPVHFVHIYM